MSDGTTPAGARPAHPEHATLDGAAETPRARVRTGGRSERARQAVAQAVLDLLAERVVDFGPSEVAARAGLTRKTIYRWWPTFADLVREGLNAHSSAVEVPDTGSWERDLRELAHRLARFFASPVEVSTNAIIAAHGTPELTALIFEHFEPIQESWRTVVVRGISRGEVHPDCTPETVLNTLASPLILTPLTRHRPATPQEIDTLVDLVLRATRP
ncbi:TetR-like C-terminal domain-containing protein [Spirillospora sp. NPDC047418]